LARQRTTAVVFPFDLFGSAGSAAGAQLLGDALQEMLDDNELETVPMRAQAYQAHLLIDECNFDDTKSLTSWRSDGGELLRKTLKKDRFTIWLSGNHLGVLPVYDHFDASMTIVQYDAHLDLYHLHDCQRELSHGNFLREIASPMPIIHQIGHRDLFLAPSETTAIFRTIHPATGAIPEVAKLVPTGPIWLDIDCDVFDPAYFPAVTQPLPFGLSPRELLQSWQGLDWSRVVGVSLSEFEPGRDRDDRSLSSLIWLLEYMLLRVYEP